MQGVRCQILPCQGMLVPHRGVDAACTPAAAAGTAAAPAAAELCSTPDGAVTASSIAAAVR